MKAISDTFIGIFLLLLLFSSCRNIFEMESFFLPFEHEVVVVRKRNSRRSGFRKLGKFNNVTQAGIIKTVRISWTSKIFLISEILRIPTLNFHVLIRNFDSGISTVFKSKMEAVFIYLFLSLNFKHFGDPENT